MTALTIRQELAFKKAAEAGQKLMEALYEIRQSFISAEGIAPNGDKVWDHIPDAQTTLQKVSDLIKLAKTEAEK